MPPRPQRLGSLPIAPLSTANRVAQVGLSKPVQWLRSTAPLQEEFCDERLKLMLKLMLKLVFGVVLALKAEGLPIPQYQRLSWHQSHYSMAPPSTAADIVRLARAYP
jgi:hypothetical protein